jgi:hypothetical protein
MSARMLAIDLRRGPAPLLALAVLVLAGAPALGDAGGCVDAALSLREAMWLVFPCVLAAGVWRGGAARRRHVDEAIAVGALPAWRRAAVEGGSIGLAGAATLVLLGGALALGGCGLGDAGVGAVAVVAVLAAAFAGLALGRVASAPMGAPLALFAGLAVTATFGGWSPGGSDAMLLLPGVAENVTAAQLTGVAAAQVLWFAGLAVAGWLAASGRRLAAVAVVVAGLAAVPALG